MDKLFEDIQKHSRYEHTTDHDETFDDKEANTPDGLIPDSYVEDGIRHILVHNEGLDSFYELSDGKLIETSPF